MERDTPSSAIPAKQSMLELRKHKWAQQFDSAYDDPNNKSECAQLMHKLENLKTQELRPWCDQTTLQTYVERRIIPRGL